MLKVTRLTQQGFKELLQDQEKLEEERISAVKALQQAREMGDLSENAAYKVARSRLSGIDGRLKRLKKILHKVEIVTPNISGFADIGSALLINNGTEDRNIILVDGWESDFRKGKISIYSPVGKALRGKKTGDRIEIYLPSGNMFYVIKKIT